MAQWDDLFLGDTFAPPEPDPFVVAYADMLRASGPTVLDLGCGAGRHVAWMADAGFAPVGTDGSSRAVMRTAALLERRGTPAPLVVSDMHALPFRDACFDGVVSIKVLYHTTREGMLRALDDVGRALKRGGVFLGTFLSTRTWKYGEGERIEPDTFVQARGPEAGIAHHYCDEAEVPSLLRGFTVEHMELDEFVEDGELHSHWQVVATAR